MGSTLIQAFIYVSNLFAMGADWFAFSFGAITGSTMADRAIRHFHPDRYPWHYEIPDVDYLTQDQLLALRRQIRDAVGGRQ